MTLFNVLILSSCLALIANPVSALMITEVQISGDQTDHDYVKIYNPGKEIDVGGFQLRKKSSTGREYSLRVFPKEIFIGEMGYLIWANSTNDFAKSIDANLSSKATLSKDNSVAIFDSSGNIISALAWGSGQDQFIEGLAAIDNPEKNQLITRRQIDNEYQSTQSNKDDFYLTGDDFGATEFPIKNNLLSVKNYSLFRYQPRSIIELILAAIIISILFAKIIDIYLKNNFKKT